MYQRSNWEGVAGMGKGGVAHWEEMEKGGVREWKAIVLGLG